MQVAIITHTTQDSDVFRYVGVKQNFNNACTTASVLIMDKLMNGIYANNDDIVLDIVDREEDNQATIVRAINNDDGTEYEAYHITEKIVD